MAPRGMALRGSPARPQQHSPPRAPAGPSSPGPAGSRRSGRASDASPQRPSPSSTQFGSPGMGPVPGWSPPSRGGSGVSPDRSSVATLDATDWADTPSRPGWMSPGSPRLESEPQPPAPSSGAQRSLEGAFAAEAKPPRRSLPDIESDPLQEGLMRAEQVSEHASWTQAVDLGDVRASVNSLGERVHRVESLAGYVQRYNDPAVEEGSSSSRSTPDSALHRDSASSSVRSGQVAVDLSPQRQAAQAAASDAEQPPTPSAGVWAAPAADAHGSARGPSPKGSAGGAWGRPPTPPSSRSSGAPAASSKVVAQAASLTDVADAGAQRAERAPRPRGAANGRNSDDWSLTSSSSGSGAGGVVATSAQDGDPAGDSGAAAPRASTSSSSHGSAGSRASLVDQAERSAQVLPHGAVVRLLPLHRGAQGWVVVAGAQAWVPHRLELSTDTLDDDELRVQLRISRAGAPRGCLRLSSPLAPDRVLAAARDGHDSLSMTFQPAGPSVAKDWLLVLRGESSQTADGATTFSGTLSPAGLEGRSLECRVRLLTGKTVHPAFRNPSLAPRAGSASEQAPRGRSQRVAQLAATWEASTRSSDASAPRSVSAAAARPRKAANLAAAWESRTPPASAPQARRTSDDAPSHGPAPSAALDGPGSAGNSGVNASAAEIVATARARAGASSAPARAQATTSPPRERDTSPVVPNYAQRLERAQETPPTPQTPPQESPPAGAASPPRSAVKLAITEALALANTSPSRDKGHVLSAVSGLVAEEFITVLEALAQQYREAVAEVARLRGQRDRIVASAARNVAAARAGMLEAAGSAVAQVKGAVEASLQLSLHKRDVFHREVRVEKYRWRREMHLKRRAFSGMLLWRDWQSDFRESQRLDSMRLCFEHWQSFTAGRVRLEERLERAYWGRLAMRVWAAWRDRTRATSALVAEARARRARRILYAWRDEAKHSALLGRKELELQDRQEERLLRKCLRGWAAAALPTADDQRRLEMFRATQRHRRQRLVVAAWRERVSVKREVRAEARALEEVRERDRMRTMLRAWKDAVQHAVMLDALVERYRERADALRVTSVWSRWAGLARARRRQEITVARYTQRRQRALKASVLRAWSDRAAAKSAAHAHARKATARMVAVRTRDAFVAWRAECEEAAAERAAAAAAKKASEDARARDVLREWRHATLRAADRTNAFAKALQGVARRWTVREAWESWRGACMATNNLTSLFHALQGASRRRTVREAWKAWRGACSASARLRAVARERGRAVLDREAADAKQAAFRALKEHADRRRALRRAAERVRASRRRLRGKAILRAWRTAAQEAIQRREIVSRNVAGKAVARDHFLRWYWTAYEGEITGTLSSLFRRCEDAITSVAAVRPGGRALSDSPSDGGVSDTPARSRGYSGTPGDRAVSMESWQAGLQSQMDAIRHAVHTIAGPLPARGSAHPSGASPGSGPDGSRRTAMPSPVAANRAPPPQGAYAGRAHALDALAAAANTVRSDRASIGRSAASAATATRSPPGGFAPPSPPSFAASEPQQQVVQRISVPAGSPAAATQSAALARSPSELAGMESLQRLTRVLESVSQGIQAASGTHSQSSAPPGAAGGTPQSRLVPWPPGEGAAGAEGSVPTAPGVEANEEPVWWQGWGAEEDVEGWLTELGGVEGGVVDAGEDAESDETDRELAALASARVARSNSRSFASPV
ncbi:unnamed protein product [Pedinophyceae sp. YPF-701]|nr:unnamed protein product [Pedinophyceae sp. YPF-701]